MTMVEERPLAISTLAVLTAAVAVITLNLSFLVLLPGNLLGEMFRPLDNTWATVGLVTLGIVGVFIAYNLWAGQATAWVSMLFALIVDMALRIWLALTNGTGWVILAMGLELDFVLLYYLRKPSVMPFFGGEGVREVVAKFRIEMQPRLKEYKFTLRLLRKSPLSIIGAAIIIFYVLMALFAPVLAPPGDLTQGGDPNMMPIDQDLLARTSMTPQPPSIKHPFGTMESQYDMYYGCIWGVQSALRIGLYVAGGSMLIGLAIGVLSSYYGGWIDEVLMRFTDIIFAFPGLILCMALVVILVPLGLNRLDAIMLALTIVGWPGYARLIRGEILRIKNEDYVEAAKSVGCSDFRVIRKHILPNSIYPILIVFTLDIGTIVLAAAALSFLGLGAPVGYAEWGAIIYRSLNWIYGPPGNPFLYWYTFLIPGLFISLFVMGWNLLGDALRDVLDPTLRRK